MDRHTSNILGMSVVAGILALLIGAFFFVVLAARTHSQPEISIADTIPLPAPAAANAPLAAHATIKLKPEALVKAEPAPRFPLGYNFALAEHGGRATGGKHPELLIDGKSTNYDAGTGYAFTQWRAKEPFVIELAETFEIDCVRFLLWDIEENRFYRYRLEASNLSDGKWTVLADKSAPQQECRSWQVFRFEKQKVKRLRLTGTFNSANSGFHVVEFQACLAPANGFPLEPKAPSYVPPPLKQKEDLEF